MEASAALEQVTQLWSDSNDTVGVEYIVSDDDSTIRVHLHHTANRIIRKLLEIFLSHRSW